MIHIGSRVTALLPGLVALGAVLGIGALLIAGYGMPVGFGLMAGFLTGLIAGLAIAISTSNRLRDHSVSFDSRALHAFGESGPAEMPDPMRDMDRVQRVDHGPLVRVVPGGAAAVAGGIHVELIALEIRSTGVMAHVTAAAAPPEIMMGSLAQVVVEDDRGTAYVAAGFGGNGSPDRMRYEVRFAPVPPDEATEIRIRIDAFLDPFPRPSSGPRTGPWLLVIPVG